jgi:methylmalonic aciduria homocystinuria type C protein
VDLARLAAAGFDILHVFDPARVAHEHGLERLASPAGHRGVIVGNTRALWPKFLAARRADPALRAAQDPLDTYTEREVTAAAPGAVSYFSHRLYDGAFLPFQRLAAAAGLAALAPTQLLIHPKYGPWFGLRAIVIAEGEPISHSPSPLPCQCDAACRDALARARFAEGWRVWLAVRDSCPIGREYRYGEAQIAYHYTKDPAVLGPSGGGS